MHEGTIIRFTEAQTASGDWEHYVLYPDVKIVNKIEVSFFPDLPRHILTLCTSGYQRSYLLDRGHGLVLLVSTRYAIPIIIRYICSSVLFYAHVHTLPRPLLL